MSRRFTDGDLLVHLGVGENWRQRFVDTHAAHERPHGQMKLLCSNLLGLALVEQQMNDQNDGRSIQLVVAGASPGTHMLVLLKHIGKWREARGVRIHLYDTQPLDADLQAIVEQDKSMYFYRRFFTDKDAQRWRNSNDCVVFFSDIRSPIHSKRLHVHTDEVQIAADMQAQKTWVEIMRPDYCMLKFHAPHATKDQKQVQASFRYLKGDLNEQAYVGRFSAEYRLFCTREDIQATDMQYETEEIERHAFFHTRRTRPSTFTVNNKQMRYDDAFAAHVAHKAQRLLRIDAQQLLRDAYKDLHVAPMQFPWPHKGMSRTQALYLRIQQIAQIL